ncbi:MAG: folylpolyglutamate synthase/dihydrofolate synthase family protein [Rickettsiales bacterium]
MSDVIEQFLKRLHHPFMVGIDLSLERVMRLLSMLGNPHKSLPPVIHVAGTNGKGSLIAYLHYIFEEAGYRVHRYTSPHLVHFSERIIVQGKEIENDYVEKIFHHMTPALQRQQVTFFEAVTVAAFIAFAEKPADILLLETGLGGRLDATNVVTKPLLTVITPIDVDHTEFLGDTIEQIAAEKAGIIKKKVPCVIGKQGFSQVLEILEKTAGKMEVPLFRLGKEWRVDGERYISEEKNIELTPSLAGEHQYDNAATAAACIELITKIYPDKFSISEANIKSGLTKTIWPARIQRLDSHPYIAMLPNNTQLWLDGGHNYQGGQMLGKWLKEKSEEYDIYLICGMIKGKDSKKFLSMLTPHIKMLCGVTIVNESNTQAGSIIASMASDLGTHSLSCESIEKALLTISGEIIDGGNRKSLVCICGSLYLAGRVLEISG